MKSIFLLALFVLIFSSGCGNSISANLWTNTSQSQVTSTPTATPSATPTTTTYTSVTTLDFTTSGKLTINTKTSTTGDNPITCTVSLTTNVSVSSNEIKIPYDSSATTKEGCSIILQTGTWKYSVQWGSSSKDDLLTIVINGVTTVYTKK